jgi:protein-tyrosine phosphatase
MASVLVVCTGNVCRSPIAEGFLRTALRRRAGADAPDVSSGGTAGWEGASAMPEAVRAAAERGVDIGGHVARRLTRGHVVDADLVVCMAAEHRDAVQHAMPEAADKTFTLKELVRLLEASGQDRAASYAHPDLIAAGVDRAAELRRGGFSGNPYDEDVVDPLGLPLESYRAIAWELDEWTSRLAKALLGDAPAAATAGADEDER